LPYSHNYSPQRRETKDYGLGRLRGKKNCFVNEILLAEEKKFVSKVFDKVRKEN